MTPLPQNTFPTNVLSYAPPLETEKDAAFRRVREGVYPKP